MRQSRNSSVESLEIEVGGIALAVESHPSESLGSSMRFNTPGGADFEASNVSIQRASDAPGSHTSNARLRSRDHGNRGQNDSTFGPMLEKKDSIGASLLGPLDEEVEEDSRRIRRGALRNDAAFWFLGLINNSGYVIMMAVAKEIAPDAVGVVFLADVAPTLLLKISAPFWFHLVPYSVRVWICAALMVLALVTVGYGGSTAVQLLGVCCLALQSGLGESSFLALASLYDTPRALTAWSSGTGFAGIFGYTWVFVLNTVFGFSFRWTLMTANLLAVAWLLTYFRLLSDPHSPHGGTISTTAVSTRAYSPLPSGQQSAPSPLLDGTGGRHISIGGEEKGEVWSSAPGGSRLDAEPVESSRAADMTARERLYFALGLWRFTVPLMLVYFAEYTMQTGTWSAIGFPVSSESARQRFYLYANLCYQGGVFVSRSSGMLVRLSPLALWSLPVLQVAMLLFFYLVAIERFWYDNSLLFLCFGVGLLGGLGYVNAFRLVAEAVPPELKELALASASVGDSIGVMLSDIFGMFVQACVYKQNGIPGAWATC